MKKSIFTANINQLLGKTTVTFYFKRQPLTEQTEVQDFDLCTNGKRGFVHEGGLTQCQ